MIGDELKYRIRKAFGHVPTPEQEQALDTFSRFMTDRNENAVMVLRGSAGTGKTTLAAAMVRPIPFIAASIARSHSRVASI